MSNPQRPAGDDLAGAEARLARQLDVYYEHLRRGSSAVRPAAETAENEQLLTLIEHLYQAASLLERVATVEANALTAAYAPTGTSAVLPGWAGVAPPEQIGKYRVQRVLGCGGQAACLLAFDPDLQRHVVLKLFHVVCSTEEHHHLLQEGRALARVRSPYVAQCYGVERHEGLSYLVMEYVPGPSLAEKLNKGPFDVTEALRLVTQLAEGLAAVHACGLIHRDVKPANIILADDGRARLVDFGLAVHIASDALQEISGTPAYMAPEQARGEMERVDQRSDLFGLGAVLYEMVVGRPLRQARDRMELLRLAQQGTMPAAHEFPAEVPARVVALCRWCLMADPLARPASALELKHAIEKLLRPPIRPVHRLALGAGLGVAAAAGLVLALSLATRSKTGPEDAAAAGDRSPSIQAVERVARFVPLQTLPASHPDGRPLRQDFAVDVQVHGGSPDAAGIVQLVEGQELALSVRPERSCFVRVFTVEYEERIKRQPDRMVMLFPNQAEPDHRCLAGQIRTVPGEPTVAGMSRQRIVTSASRGPEFLLLVATTQQWDTGAGQLAGVYRSFATEDAVRGLQQRLRGLELQTEATPNVPTAVSQVLIPYHVRPQE